MDHTARTDPYCVAAVDEQVGRLDVPVDDFVEVEVAQPAHDVRQHDDARGRCKWRLVIGTPDPPARARSAHNASYLTPHSMPDIYSPRVKAGEAIIEGG